MNLEAMLKRKNQKVESLDQILNKISLDYLIAIKNKDYDNYMILRSKLSPRDLYTLFEEVTPLKLQELFKSDYDLNTINDFKIENKHQMIDAYERWFWLMHQANGSYEDEKVEILSIMLKEYVDYLGVCIC